MYPTQTKGKSYTVILIALSLILSTHYCAGGILSILHTEEINTHYNGWEDAPASLRFGLIEGRGNVKTTPYGMLLGNLQHYDHNRAIACRADDMRWGNYATGELYNGPFLMLGAHGLKGDIQGFGTPRLAGRYMRRSLFQMAQFFNLKAESIRAEVYSCSSAHNAAELIKGLNGWDKKNNLTRGHLSSEGNRYSILPYVACHQGDTNSTSKLIPGSATPGWDQNLPRDKYSRRNSFSSTGYSCGNNPSPVGAVVSRVKMFRSGIMMGVVNEAMPDMGIDPRISGGTMFVLSTSMAYRYGPKGAVKANLIGTGSAFGAAILADNMGASAEQTEAASEFGGFAGGFAAGPHAGIAGGIMQVGQLVGKTGYQMGKGTYQHGGDYWVSWWGTGYCASFSKCYFGR